MRSYEDESRAKVIQKLQDWKELAPDAQRRINLIMRGLLPDPTTPQNQPPRLRPVIGFAACAEAQMVFKACAYIIERAYPAKRHLTHELVDPAGTLAAILGVSSDALPRQEDDATGIDTTNN